MKRRQDFSDMKRRQDFSDKTSEDEAAPLNDDKEKGITEPRSENGEKRGEKEGLISGTGIESISLQNTGS